MAPPPSVEAIVRAVEAALPESLRQVTRTQVEVRSAFLGAQAPGDEDLYWARLDLERPEPVATWLGIARPVAVALAGLLVMMQEKVVREKVEQGEITDEDLESLEECISHISTVFDEAVAEAIGEQHEFGFAEGGFDLDVPDRDVVRWRAELAVGDLATGPVVWVLPASGFGEGQRKPATGGEGAAAAGEGVELSAEEMAAIREVAASASFGGGVVVLAPVERVRATWEALGKDGPVSVEVVRTVFELRRVHRVGTIEAVVVDGDVLPGGGVAALGITRRWAAPGVPVLMAASRPTRHHVAAALAAGAAAYLVKPCTGEDLARGLERARAAPAELHAPV